MPHKLFIGLATTSLALLALIIAVKTGTPASVQAQEPATSTPVATNTAAATNTPAVTSTAVGTATVAPTATPIAGLAARLQLSVSASTTCGQSTVNAFVTDGFGNPVPNGTSVFYATNLGSISSSPTSGGFSSGALTVPSGVVGPASVNVSAGSVNNSIVVPFTPCAAATAVATSTPVPSTPAPIPGQGGAEQSQPPAQPQQQQRTTQPQVGISPPNTGDGGLLR